MAIGLLIIRLVVGLTVAAHGAQKLFGWFGGGGPRGTGAMLEASGFRPGPKNALIAGASELGGGLLLALGLLTPLGSAAVVGVLAVAWAVTGWSKGFFAQRGGFELIVVLGAVAAGLAFTGPGRISFDHALGLDLSGLPWGFAAVLLGLVAAGLRLAGRRRPQEIDLRSEARQPTNSR